MTQKNYLVVGTDTDIGKTVFAAGLTHALNADYWKPVQAGIEDGTDKKTVTELADLTADRMHEEAYCLTVPASPHLSAEKDGVDIDPKKIQIPQTQNDKSLVIEAAGGLLVPLIRPTVAQEGMLMLDLFAKWDVKVILSARTTLGTINHTLLSVKALQDAGMNIAGLVFIGEDHEDNERVICEFSKLPSLGRLPIVDPLDHENLARAFSENLDLSVLKS